MFHLQHPQRNSEPHLFRKALNRSGWQILGLRFGNLCRSKPAKYWTQILSVTFCPPRHWIMFQFFHKNAIRGDLGKDPSDAVLECPMIWASTCVNRWNLRSPAVDQRYRRLPGPQDRKPHALNEVQESNDSSDSNDQWFIKIIYSV